MKTLTLIVLLSGVPMIPGCSDSPKNAPSPLAAKIARFAPVVIGADTASLTRGDREALAKLIEAARIIDRLYLRQAWEGNEALLRKLEADNSPEGRERLAYFHVNMGPWSRLDNNDPFIPGAPRKPQQANLYPDDMTKEEFTAWQQSLPPGEQKAATGYFTVIRRTSDRRLVSVPYSVEYRDLLIPLAQLLRDAAAHTDNASLETYLIRRAEAFVSNDYYKSDLAWMELNSPLEITIGPYEVYMDEFFNYKAAFEAFITVRNDRESERLAFFSAHLQDIENHLPIDGRYKNPKLGTTAPIRVVDQVAVGGEARAGVQTAAFNLPNDEQIVAERGSKRVMLKNVQEAKFATILKPIAGLVIDPVQQPLLAFEPFFTHILAHELLHGLGPHSIIVNGKTTTVRQALKEISSAFEEAKADVSALYALQYLMDIGALPRDNEQRLYVTFLAGVFRSIRFGINEAHGRGMALQFNFLTSEGAFVYNEKTGTYRVDFDKMKMAIRKLTGVIMTIQAKGDYEGARTMIDRYAVVTVPMQRTLDKLAALPVDIQPVQAKEDKQ